MTDSSDNSKGQPGIGQAALFGLCPRCGAKTMFASPIGFADKCRSCGLDYGKFNVGDGPAAFLTLIIGTIVVILAIWVQLAAEPPWWLHVLLWVPLTFGGVVFGLRMAKGMLLVREYRSGAEEHRHQSSDPD